MFVTNDILRRRFQPSGSLIGTTVASAGSGIPPPAGREPVMINVIPSNRDRIPDIWRGNPPSENQRPVSSCQHGLNDMAHTFISNPL